MAELKTKENDGDVRAFIESVEDESKRDDCWELLKMIEEVTSFPPKMWGASIVGFGQYHYKYKTGREGDWFLTGFSPRKQNMTVYLMPDFARFDTLPDKLGKHKMGKGCLYFKKLEDLDREVLREMIKVSTDCLLKMYPAE